MNIYKETNVFEEALNRIRMIYDYHDEVIVSMSGGKDSTVLFNLTLMVAKEKNRLPVKVFWIDQEAEWKATVDYMESVMKMEEVEPYWYQIPFDFTNSLSAKDNFLLIWDENEKDKWIHPKSDMSIKENPTKKNRFHELINELPKTIAKTDKCAVLVGMRVSESINRKMAIAHGKGKFRGETWCKNKSGKTQVFWPIYDFTNDDIWTAIAKNHWNYNKVYDLMYRWGIPKTRMRVSSLIHETAWHNMEMLHEFEKETYNKFTARVHGASTFDHAFEESGVIPRQLPFAFKDWKEYRDYLLVHITKPEYWELFQKRWQGQNDEDWYKVHVKEIILNDIDGTNNSNHKSKRKLDRNVSAGKYNNIDKSDFYEWRENNDK